MKLILPIVSLLFVVFNAHSEDSKCYCGTYKYDYVMKGNSTNHFRLIDGTSDAALIRDTEKTFDKRYINTEVQMEWPGKKGTYVPALDQIANNDDSICVQGRIVDDKLQPNPQGTVEKISYYEFIENVFPAGSKCEGEPISINIQNVKKAELPH